MDKEEKYFIYLQNLQVKFLVSSKKQNVLMRMV